MAGRDKKPGKAETGDAPVEPAEETPSEERYEGLPAAEEPQGAHGLMDGEEAAEEATEQAEFLGFMLSDEEYALDILEIKEIIRLQTITAVPRTPAYLKGIITLRGVIIPVFDLRCRLGLEEAGHGPSTRIVVVYRGEEYAGLIVDSITQVMRVRVGSVEPPPPTIGVVEAEFIKGVTRYQDRLIILLNLGRVLEVKA